MQGKILLDIHNGDGDLIASEGTLFEYDPDRLEQFLIHSHVFKTWESGLRQGA